MASSTPLVSATNVGWGDESTLPALPAAANPHTSFNAHTYKQERVVRGCQSTTNTKLLTPTLSPAATGCSV